MPTRRPSAPILLNIQRVTQPDDVTCGPTCLAKVYQYYGFERPLGTIIRETPRNPDGGTLAVSLACSALAHGFRPTIYPFGLRVFDPTWRRLPQPALLNRLRRRAAAVPSAKLQRAVREHITFLEAGGTVRFRELTPALLVGLLRRGHPVLTGLSSTYLYGTPRERDDHYDDIAGSSAGHFVVVHGYRPRSRRFVVTDPFPNVPLSQTGRYTVPADRLVAAILLGDQTYDAVILALGRRRTGRR